MKQEKCCLEQQNLREGKRIYQFRNTVRKISPFSLLMHEKSSDPKIQTPLLSEKKLKKVRNRYKYSHTQNDESLHILSFKPIRASNQFVEYKSASSSKKKVPFKTQLNLNNDSSALTNLNYDDNQRVDSSKLFINQQVLGNYSHRLPTPNSPVSLSIDSENFRTDIRMRNDTIQRSFQSTNSRLPPIKQSPMMITDNIKDFSFYQQNVDGEKSETNIRKVFTFKDITGFQSPSPKTGSSAKFKPITQTEIVLPANEDTQRSQINTEELLMQQSQQLIQQLKQRKIKKKRGQQSQSSKHLNQDYKLRNSPSSSQQTTIVQQSKMQDVTNPLSSFNSEVKSTDNSVFKTNWTEKGDSMTFQMKLIKNVTESNPSKIFSSVQQYPQFEAINQQKKVLIDSPLKASTIHLRYSCGLIEQYREAMNLVIKKNKLFKSPVPEF